MVRPYQRARTQSMPAQARLKSRADRAEAEVTTLKAKADKLEAESAAMRAFLCEELPSAPMCAPQKNRLMENFRLTVFCCAILRVLSPNVKTQPKALRRLSVVRDPQTRHFS
jgi:hypothetical protein